MKNSKLSTLTVLAGAAYFLLFISFFTNDWEGMKLAFHQGFSASEKGERFTDNSAEELHLSPKGGYLSFPEKILNQKDGELLDARFSTIRVQATNSGSLPFKIRLYRTLITILSFFVFVIFIVIPVQFFKLLASVKKGKIYERPVIARFKYLGYAFILFYFCDMAFSLMDYEILKTLFQFENYTINRNTVNVISLLLGLVFWIIHEMLLKGLEIKEEQELTI